MVSYDNIGKKQNLLFILSGNAMGSCVSPYYCICLKFFPIKFHGFLIQVFYPPTHCIHGGQDPAATVDTRNHG